MFAAIGEVLASNGYISFPSFVKAEPCSCILLYVPVNLLINMLFTTRRIYKHALLLAVRPLKVGSRKLTRCYYEYKPSQE